MLSFVLLMIPPPTICSNECLMRIKLVCSRWWNEMAPALRPQREVAPALRPQREGDPGRPTQRRVLPGLGGRGPENRAGRCRRECNKCTGLGKPQEGDQAP